MWLQEITLESKSIKLTPLKPEHESGLLDAAAYGQLWEFGTRPCPAKTLYQAILNKQ